MAAALGTAVAVIPGAMAAAPHQEVATAEGVTHPVDMAAVAAPSRLEAMVAAPRALQAASNRRGAVAHLVTAAAVIRHHRLVDTVEEAALSRVASNHRGAVDTVGARPRRRPSLVDTAVEALLSRAASNRREVARRVTARPHHTLHRRARPFAHRPQATAAALQAVAMAAVRQVRQAIRRGRWVATMKRRRRGRSLHGRTQPGAAAGTAAEAAVEAAEGTAGVEVARRALTMPRPRESWRRRGRHQAQVEGRAAVALHRRPTRRHRVAACLPKRV